MRGVFLALSLIAALPAGAQTAVDAPRSNAGLQDWITAFRAKALAAGIDAQVYDAAMADVTYAPKVVERDRNQSEFTKTIWDYLETAVSDARINNGRVALRREKTALAAIETRYGVPAQILAAIWGLESAYGTFRGSDPVLTSMASLAYDARRAEFFERQVIAALRIVQNGDTSLQNLQGSWAGAMGHTQFMPGSFIDHAVEVLKTPTEWAGLGVLDVAGEAVSNHGPASILLPAGAEGAAFMIFKNFEVLESYNTADAYVIAVGHLADRIMGAGPLAADWPVQDRALSYAERIELQERLTAQGFDTQKIDAKIGPLTVNAVRGWQLAQGEVPDGYASPRFLERPR